MEKETEDDVRPIEGWSLSEMDVIWTVLMVPVRHGPIAPEWLGGGDVDSPRPDATAANESLSLAIMQSPSHLVLPLNHHPSCPRKISGATKRQCARISVQQSNKNFRP